MSRVCMHMNNRMNGKRFKSGLLAYILRAIIKKPCPVGSMCMFTFWAAAMPSWSAVTVSYVDSCVVNDTVIRLGDIARVQADCPDSVLEKLIHLPVGESAPAGYSRYVNTNDFVTFSMKARFPNLGAINSPNKRILVKTDFQERSIGEFGDSIEKYLGEKVAWPSGAYTVLIINKTEKWKCLPKPFSIKIDGLLSGYPKGNFNLKLIAEQGSKRYINTISCFNTVVVPVVVSKINIPRGTLLSSENCSIIVKDITHYNYIPYYKLNEIENTKSSRAVQAGTIICDKLVLKTPIIERDDQVQIMVTHGRVRICMSARARESGSVGEKIWVENEMTHKLLKTKVLSHGKVILIDGEGTI